MDEEPDWVMVAGLAVCLFLIIHYAF